MYDVIEVRASLARFLAALLNPDTAVTAVSLAWPCQSVFWRLRRCPSIWASMASMWRATTGLRPSRPDVSISTEPSPAGTVGSGIGAPLTDSERGGPPEGGAEAGGGARQTAGRVA